MNVFRLPPKGLGDPGAQEDAPSYTDRPIMARAATDNIGSTSVLQKCDFKITGKNKDSASGRGEDTKNTFFVWMAIKQINQEQRIGEPPARVTSA